MANEFEVVQHLQISNLNTFVNWIDYRTPHLHRDFEICLVLEGTIHLFSQNQEYVASKSELLLLNPNQPHELRTQDIEGATLLCLQISPQYFKDLLPSIEELYFDTVLPFQCIPSAKSDEIIEYMVELGIQYQAKRPYYELICLSLTNMIFFQLLEHLPTHRITHDERQSMEKKVGRISKILDYVDNNYMYRVCLSDIAKEENLSLSHLSLFVKENLNQTFQDYVNTVRFNQARKLILTTDKRLIDICLETGFSDSRYLTKAFLNRTGMTPSEFRKKHRSDEFDTSMHISLHSSQRYYSQEDTISLLKKAQVDICRPLIT